MRQKTYGCIIIILAFLLNAAYAEVMLPTSLYPPVIAEVKFYPEEPIEKQDVRITATVFNDQVKTEDTVVTVQFHTSKDGGKTWNVVDMEQSKENEKQWHATLPGEMKMMDVLFYISAEDTSGNISTEMSASVTPQDEKSWLPSDENLVVIAKDEDDGTNVVSDELDLLKISAGADEKFLYLKFEAQGNIPDETIKAQNNFLPEIDYSLSSLAEESYWKEFYGTHFGYYSPALSYLGAIHPCAVGRFDANGYIHREDFKNVDYIRKGNTLYLRIQKELVASKTTDALKTFFFTALESMDFSERGTLYDVTAFSYFYLRNHIIKYKSGSIIKPILDDDKEK